MKDFSGMWKKIKTGDKGNSSRIQVYMIKILDTNERYDILVSSRIGLEDALNVIAGEFKVPYRNIELLDIVENKHHSTLDFTKVSDGIWMPL